MFFWLTKESKGEKGMSGHIIRNQNSVFSFFVVGRISNGVKRVPYLAL